MIRPATVASAATNEDGTDGRGSPSPGDVSSTGGGEPLRTGRFGEEDAVGRQRDVGEPPTAAGAVGVKVLTLTLGAADAVAPGETGVTVKLRRSPRAGQAHRTPRTRSDIEAETFTGQVGDQRERDGIPERGHLRWSGQA